jgi:tripartite ATP-independent transporter DctP family solute receptor
MRGKRTISALAVALASVSAIAGCAKGSSSSGSSGSSSSGKTYTIVTACPSTSISPNCAALRYMATEASTLSNGQLKMQVHYNPSLGTTAETAKLVKQGQIQLSLQSPSDEQPFYGPMALFSLPFLFSGIAAVHSAYSGAAGQSLSAGLQKAAGVKTLDWQDVGFNQLLSSKGFVTSLSAIKGQKVRIISDPILADTYSSVGAIPSPYELSDVYTGYQTGSFTVSALSPSTILANKFQEVAKYLTQENIQFQAELLVVNLKFWNSLPKDLQADLQKAATLNAQHSNALYATTQASNLATLKTEGVKTAQMPASVVSQWDKIAQQKVYPAFEKQYGSSLLADLGKAG